jgi:hypothetical protein
MSLRDSGHLYSIILVIKLFLQTAVILDLSKFGHAVDAFGRTRPTVEA